MSGGIIQTPRITHAVPVGQFTEHREVGYDTGVGRGDQNVTQIN